MTSLNLKAQVAPSNPTKPSLLAHFGQWAEMIKLEHTVFALPFALSGLILGSNRLPGWTVVIWTVLAFTGARCAAMTLNRLIDAEIDAKNPRTQSRAIAKGQIKRIPALMFSLCSFALMLFSASHLPPICLMLSPIAVIWLSFYSYTKRFTWLCHFCLGIALAGAALGGWLASGGNLGQLAPWFLSAAVLTWVTGFDIIYACQDFEVDRRQNIFSIPSRFGLSQALTISSILHIFTIALLMLVGLSLGLGPIYWLGVIQAAIMLAWEHSLVKPTDLSRVNAAFFTVNGWVSIFTFLAILVDRCLSL